jgi:hypothetical protein
MAGKRIVLFLGAGASAPFGYPTTDAILPRIHIVMQDALKNRARPEWARRLEKRDPNIWRELQRGIGLVLPGVAPRHATKNASITDVLSVIDYLINARLSLAPDFRDPELRKMRHQLGMCINGVLRGASSLHIRNKLLGWMLARARTGDRIGIVTTNYDCLYDIPLAQALEMKGQKALEAVDFGTTVLSPGSREYFRPADARFALLKLHGSLNWLRCELCGALYVNPKQRIITLAYWDKPTVWNTCRCEGRLREVLIAPSLVRDIRNPHLLANWVTALSELREASEWIFIGYSLPPEDIEVRALLLRALHGRNRRGLRVRLALRDRGEMRRREKSPAQPPTDVRAIFDEQLSANTLQRYRDFLPTRCFSAGEGDYFPAGVEQIVAHLSRHES